MTEWLKFYFLGFFSEKLTRQAVRRGFLNVVLSVLLGFILLFAGLYTGYKCSFGRHFSDAGEFREFVYSAFASGDKTRDIVLSVKDGKLSAEIPSGNFITPYSEHGYNKNGYALVVDPRPADATFDDFTVVAKNSDGNEITYERYSEMSADARRGYSLKVNYSGNAVDVSAKQEEYKTFLKSDKCTADAKTKYEEAGKKFENGEISAEEFATEVYVQFVKGRYPDLPADRFGTVPTVRAGEVEYALKDGNRNALMIFDNLCIVAFCTDGGIRVDFDGYFRAMDDGENIVADREAADKFILEAFDTSSGADFVIYFINILRMIPFFIMVYALLSLITFAVFKLGKVEFGAGIVRALKLVGSFVLISSVFAFLFAIIISFFTARDAAFTFTVIAFTALMGIRTLVMLVLEVIKTARDGNKPADNNSESIFSDDNQRDIV